MTALELSMATEFEAAVLVGINHPLEVLTLSLMEELSRGQVLVELKSASVCGSQLLEIAGAKGNAKFVPHLLGHEGFGEVLEIGPGVEKFKVGDSVVMHWRRSSGQEAEAPRYKGPNGMVVGAGKVSTFSTMSVVSQNRLTKVSAQVDPDLATLLGCGLSTGMSAVYKQSGIGPGSSVLILGAGGIGLSVCIGASIVGAPEIVVVDRDQDKEIQARGCGATAFMTSSEFNEVLLEESGFKSNFDAVFETTGSKVMMEISLSLARDSGIVVQLGQSGSSDNLSLGPQGQAFGSIDGKTLVFSQGGGFNPDLDLASFIKQLSSADRSYWKSLIGPKGTLASVNDLIDGLRSGVPGRPILMF
jgi:Zn-dependent alcohol dehydrogenase